MGRSLLLAAALAVLALDAPAQLYKCVVDNKTVYQQEKCPSTAKETQLRTAPPPAATEAQVQAMEEKASTDTNAGYELVADVTTAFNLCVESDPGFGEKYTNTFNDWSARNGAAFKAFNANPNGPADVRRRMEVSRRKTAGDDLEGRAKRAAICARVLAIIL